MAKTRAVQIHPSTMSKILFFYLCACALLLDIAESFDRSVVTKAGRVLGSVKKIPELEKQIEVYLGIQYAVAPLGDLRFKDPEPLPAAQSNSLGRETFAPSCYQQEFEVFKDFVGLDAWLTPRPFDEDCLYLNIWKPNVSDPSGPKKPVVVWIHGGGFTLGSASVPLYDGSYLAAWTDSVVVSIQYRLGALGFLYTGDDFAPGNAGLKDQALALKWVHQHIENFGGDKDKITLIGESAGSASVGFHLLSPETSKLFKRAVLLSGTPNSDWALVQPSVAWNKTIEFARSLGADVSSYDDIKRYLLNRKASDIVAAQGAKDEFKVMFVPTIEPALVPEHPLGLLENANHLKGRQIIASWTRDEGSIFVSFEFMRLKKIHKATDIPVVYREDFLKLVGNIVGHGEETLNGMVDIYNRTTDRPYLYGLVQSYGDLFMTCPINQFIEGARNRGAVVYHAEYNYRPQKTAWPLWMGVTHGADLEMLFGYPIHRNDRYDSADRVVCRNYMDRIKHFLENGSPNWPGEPSWFEDQMFIITSTAKEQDNRTSTCSRLKKLMPRFLSGADSAHSSVFGVLGLILISLRLID